MSQDIKYLPTIEVGIYPSRTILELTFIEEVPGTMEEQIEALYLAMVKGARGKHCRPGVDILTSLPYPVESSEPLLMGIPTMEDVLLRNIFNSMGLEQEVGVAIPRALKIFMRNLFQEYIHPGDDQEAKLNIPEAMYAQIRNVFVSFDLGEGNNRLDTYIPEILNVSIRNLFVFYVHENEDRVNLEIPEAMSLYMKDLVKKLEKDPAVSAAMDIAQLEDIFSTCTSPALAPQLLEIQHDFSDGFFIPIEWGNDAQFYSHQNIYRSETPFTEGTLPTVYQQVSPSTRTFNDTVIEPVTDYFYAVSTVYPTAELLSNIVTVTTPVEIKAPSNLTGFLADISQPTNVMGSYNTLLSPVITESYVGHISFPYDFSMSPISLWFPSDLTIESGIRQSTAEETLLFPTEFKVMSEVAESLPTVNMYGVSLENSAEYVLSKLTDYSNELTLVDLQGVLTAPFTWSIVSGSLPQGIHLGTSTTITNMLSGVTDVAAGRYDVTIQLEDSQGIVFSGELKLQVSSSADPHWDNVVALLHFDEDILDQTGKGWVGNGPYGFEQGVYGSSIHFSSGNQFLNTSGEDFNLGNADFTLEIWVNQTANAGSGVNQGIFAKRHNATNQSFFLVQSGPGSDFRFGYIDSANIQHDISFSYVNSSTTNTWRHIAIVRAGAKIMCFVQGVKEKEQDVGESEIKTTDAMFVVGRLNYNTSTNPFNGKLDELRITKGVARYTENFTPPTEPFSNIKAAPDARFNSAYVLQKLQPDHFWKCDDASGNLIDSVGMMDATPVGSIVYGANSIVNNEPATSSAVILGQGSGNSGHFDTGSTFDFIANGTFTIGLALKAIGINTDNAGYIVNNSFGGSVGLQVYYENRNSAAANDRQKIFIIFRNSATNKGIYGVSLPIADFQAGATFLISSNAGSVSAYINGLLVEQKNIELSFFNGSPSNTTTFGGSDFEQSFDNIFILENGSLTAQEVQDWHSNVMKPYEPLATLPLISISGSLPPATVDTAYSSTTDITIAGTNTPITASTSGDFPAGWSVTVNGSHVEVTGPGLPIGDYTFTITVIDANSNTASLPLTLVVE